VTTDSVRIIMSSHNCSKCDCGLSVFKGTLQMSRFTFFRYTVVDAYSIYKLSGDQFLVKHLVLSVFVVEDAHYTFV